MKMRLLYDLIVHEQIYSRIYEASFRSWSRAAVYMVKAWNLAVLYRILKERTIQSLDLRVCWLSRGMKQETPTVSSAQENRQWNYIITSVRMQK